MNALRTAIHVGPDHRITGIAPPEVPPGEHLVTIPLPPRRRMKSFRLADFPIDHGPWDNTVSLRREDLYGDDGR